MSSSLGRVVQTIDLPNGIEVSAVERFSVHVLSELLSKPVLATAYKLKPDNYSLYQEYFFQHENGEVQFVLGTSEEGVDKVLYFEKLSNLSKSGVLKKYRLKLAEPKGVLLPHSMALGIYEVSSPRLIDTGVVQFGYSGEVPRIDCQERGLLDWYIDNCNLDVVKLHIRVAVLAFGKEYNPAVILVGPSGERYASRILCHRGGVMLEVKDKIDTSKMIKLNVCLGSLTISKEDFLSLRKGSLIELDTKIPLSGYISLGSKNTLAKVQLEIANQKPTLTISEFILD